MGHEETEYYDLETESQEHLNAIENYLQREDILSNEEINRVLAAVKRYYGEYPKKKKKKGPYYPYPGDKFIPAKDEKDCVAKGGQWVKGQCIVEAELPNGQGAVYEPHDWANLERIAESLKKEHTIREQWEPVCADVTTKELTGHLRDICMLSQVIKGKAGDVVNIAYVKDCDFDILTNVGDSLSEATNLVGSVQATLKEAGKYTTLNYADLEKLDGNVLAKLEEKFRTAALRAEDQVILDLLMADTDVPELDKTAVSIFDADFVAEAIVQMQKAQKIVEPGSCALVLSPSFYEDLWKDVMGSMGIVFARPDVIQKGRLTEFLGHEVRIAGYLPEWDVTNHYVSAYLIKKKACVGFAPKRNLLVETEKLTKERQLQITASHTFARVVIDPKCAVEIKVKKTL